MGVGVLYECMCVCVYRSVCVYDCEEDSLWVSTLLSQCFVKYVTSPIKNVSERS